MSKKQLASGWGGWRGWPCSCHLRCVSPGKPQAREVAPLPAEMSDAGRRWRCLWDSRFLPRFSLKANFCHKARGGFIPSKTLSAHPPMFESCSHGAPGCFLGLGIFEGTCTSSSSVAPDGSTSCGRAEKPVREQLTSDARGVNRTKSPPRVKVLAGCFLEKPSQNKSRHRKH